MIKRIMPVLMVLFIATILIVPVTEAQQQQPQIAHTFLKVGDLAPDFALRDDKFATVKLSDYRGKQNVILAFYVLAFTGG